MDKTTLQIVPVSLRQANAFVTEVHRHHGTSRGHKFSIGARGDDGNLVAVAIAGRPVARGLDDGLTLEVTRLASNGARNACSALYAAVRRAAKAMGYRRLVTYTLDSEPGTSLRAAGWTPSAEVPGRSWSCPSRPREDKHPTVNKIRWEASL